MGKNGKVAIIAVAAIMVLNSIVWADNRGDSDKESLNTIYVRLDKGEYVEGVITGTVSAYHANNTLKWTRSGLGHVLCLAAGDFNNDGIADVVVGASGKETLFALNGKDGKDIFNPIGNILLYDSSGKDGKSFNVYAQYFYIVVLANLDKDKDKEIVGATSFGALVAFDNNGKKLWQYQTMNNIEFFKRILSVTCADINGDGEDDVLFTVTNNGGAYKSEPKNQPTKIDEATVNDFYCVTSGGTALFGPINAGPQNYPELRLDNICLIDSDGDGVKDRIAVGGSDNHVRYYDLKGKFLKVSPDLDSSVIKVEAVDINNNKTEETAAETKDKGLKYIDNQGNKIISLKKDE